MTEQRIAEMLEEIKLEQVKQNEKLIHAIEIIQELVKLRHEQRIQRMEDILLGHDNSSGLIRESGKQDARLAAQEATINAAKYWVRGAIATAALTGTLVGFLINLILKL